MITSSDKSFITASTAMTTVVNTGLKLTDVKIQDVFKTNGGSVIKDSVDTMAGKHFDIVLEFDDAVATGSSAKLTIDVTSCSDETKSATDKTILTIPSLDIKEVKGKKICIDVPHERVISMVGLTLKTGGSGETYTAGNLVSALLVPFMKH